MLHDPLKVTVTNVATQRPMPGIAVAWSIVEGSGGVLSAYATTTDDNGASEVYLTLGSAVGLFRAQASVDGQVGGPVEFEARAVLPPSLTSVPDYPVSAGDTISIGGENLNQLPGEQVVLFSGVRGRVVSVGATELRVRVPPCLPDRSVDVWLALGSVTSEPRPLQVLEGSHYLELEPGEDLLLYDPDAYSCFRLPSVAESWYLGLVHSAATSSGSRHEYRFTGLIAQASQGMAHRSPGPTPPMVEIVDSRAVHPTLANVRFELPGLPQERWGERVRALERGTLAERSSATLSSWTSPAVAESKPRPVPQIGDTRQFTVLNSENEFDTITARVRYVSDRSVIYQDLQAPSGGFEPEDFESLAREFDDPVHPAVTETFGQPSDVDENDRVIVLFTPSVNLLTSRGSDGFVAGFFYGVDLWSNRAGSNHGEVLYALVPDPRAEFGDFRTAHTILSTVPSVLAHEYQHMIHYNQRVLLRNSTSLEALWLSEALAQMAEDLVGDVFAQRGDEDKAFLYQVGNWLRARHYLSDPGGASLIATSGSGTLEERGAGWLFLRYLRGHSSSAAILRDLTQATTSGVENITVQTGRDWWSLFADWAAALYLDDTSFGVDARLEFPDIKLRETLARAQAGEGYPLRLGVRSGRDFVEEATLHASSGDFFLIKPPPAGGIAVDLGGMGGGPASPESRLQLMLVRLR